MGDRLVTIVIGRKLGSVPPFRVGELDPHLTQCGLGLGPGHIVLDWSTKWHLDPTSRSATTDMGLELGGEAVPFWGSRVPI